MSTRDVLVQSAAGKDKQIFDIIIAVSRWRLVSE